jgi:hypothetical protein
MVHAVQTNVQSVPEIVHTSVPIRVILPFAFLHCYSKTIFIPSSITNLCRQAFSSSPVHEVIFDESSPIQTLEGNTFEWSELTSIILPGCLSVIGGSAFYHCCSLRQVTFPDTLTRIGTEAFCRAALEVIFIPESLKKIGEAAFDDCRHLRSVVFVGHSHLRKIGCSAFAECGLTDFVLPSSIRRIGSLAFERCYDLTSLIIEQPCRLSILHKCICNVTGLTSLTIPVSIVEIQAGAFSSCRRLDTLTFDRGSQLQKIGERAFYACAISSLILPECLLEIGSEAFALTRFLSKLTFGDSVQQIGPRAFIGSSIGEVSFPASLTLISKWAFSNTNLTHVTFKVGLVTIESEAFAMCPLVWISPIPDTIRRIESMAFRETLLTCVIFDPNVRFEVIERDAFMDCHKLMYVRLPYHTTIENKFIGCAPAYFSPDNPFQLPNHDQFPVHRWIVNLIFDPQVKYARLPICAVQIPDSVQIIGPLSFCECWKLKRLNFGRSSQVSVIGSRAFRSTALVSISLPASVESIEEHAFANCPWLSEVLFPSDSCLTSIGRKAFKYSSLETMRIPDAVVAINESAFSSTPYLREVIFGRESQLVSIGSMAFVHSGVRKLNLPPLLKQIGDHAFSSCHGLTSISLKRTTLTVLSGNVFYEVSAQKIKLPQGIEEIRSSAFGFCLLLKRIDFGQSLRVLGGFGFAGLSELIIPDSVEMIERAGFAQCMCLRKVVIGPNSSLVIILTGAFESSSVSIVEILPGTLQKIEMKAFAGCHALFSITGSDNFRHEALERHVFGESQTRISLAFTEQTLSRARRRCWFQNVTEQPEVNVTPH